MDEKDWNFMKVLFEEKSLTRAAERLYISQPALSYRLKNIEEEFGVQLFFKTKTGIDFTSEGEYLVQYAENMQRILQVTKDNMVNMKGGVNGTLRIGVSSNFARYKLPKILKRFSTIYPSPQFSVKTGWSSDIMNLLGSSKVHVGIVRNDYEWKGEKVLLSKERLFLISKKKLQFEQLPDMPFIDYSTDQSLRNLINNWWQEHFTVPSRIAMEVDKLETCKEMVKYDLGIAIIPEMSIKETDDFYKIPLLDKGGIPLERTTWLMYDKSYMNLSVVKTFVEFVIDELKVNDSLK
ncbi:LysR family transcriptional regulator [Bacillus sp. HNG]|uniref:LysR family transcriptional regulator n=1 Tax=Bacillus sp. HNG TaxID=2293325 RepID=UPI000E2E98F9|nr:LysR family transcriptional regulator [Bacillus sp. HNG]RFB12550.1 LysR family transcriptional regulator [Bacillus sp. HNG]